MARRIVSLLATCLLKAHAELEWQYGPSATCSSTGVCGATQWGEKYEACAEIGTQSPIDATFSNATDHGSIVIEDLAFEKHGECTSATFLVNEHTSEMALEHTCPGNFSAIFGSATTGGTNIYHLHQFHWHSPSEHTIDGKYFPMEVQYVHVSDDGHFLVVSTLIGVKDEAELLDQDAKDAAEFVSTIQNSMPFESEKPRNAVRPVNFTSFGPYDFVPPLTSGYYTYEGSFTTPPCTTGVRWIIAPEPRFITQATLDKYRAGIQVGQQLATFQDITNATPPQWAPSAWSPVASWNPVLGTNVRPIQALVGAASPERKIFKVSKHGVHLDEGFESKYQSSGSLPETVVTVLLVITLVLCCCMMWAAYFIVGSMDKLKQKDKERNRIQSESDAESGE